MPGPGRVPSSPARPPWTRSFSQGLYTLLHFTRTWLRHRPVPRLQLLWVWPGDEVSHPHHAAMSGFCKTVNREHRALRYRAVSLLDETVRVPGTAAELLLAEALPAGRSG
ncbi:hypothetical protein ACN28I_16205 [Archangium gephyra]|uniref:hypothetical protein n=1 Tax=Archangium gephyra TaxID=48 RepID=UPI003B7D5A0C